MLPVFSTAYLPSIHCISSLVKFDKVAIEQKENFPKQTLRNRTCILSANGVQLLSIPVVQTHVKTITGEIEISYADGWPIKHWRAIEAAYNRSPYFLFYKDSFEEIILSEEKSLLNFNLKLLKLILKNLHSKIEMEFTPDYQKDIPVSLDYRSISDYKKPIADSSLPSYPQVFSYKFGFVPNLSSIDLLFNFGPDSVQYLRKIS